MNRILISVLTVIILLTGCGNLTDEEYQAMQEGQLTYDYEEVEATITKIDVRHWFAGTHRYEWNLEVYYEPYALEFSENSWSSGAFSCPSFFNKSEGDTISAEICNKYINGKLTERRIVKMEYFD